MNTFKNLLRKKLEFSTRHICVYEIGLEHVEFSLAITRISPNGYPSEINQEIIPCAEKASRECRELELIQLELIDVAEYQSACKQLFKRSIERLTRGEATKQFVFIYYS